MAGVFAHNPSFIVRIAQMIDSHERKNESELNHPTKLIVTHAEGASIFDSIRRFFRLCGLRGNEPADFPLCLK